MEVQNVEEKRGSCRISEEAEELEEHELRIPHDILPEVLMHNIHSFQTVLEKPSTTEQWKFLLSNFPPMQASAVCRSWRESTLKARRLWSTWCLTIDSPTKEVLSVLECFLKLLINRSGNLSLGFKIHFVGQYDTAEAHKSIVPLMDQQRRWEEADLALDEEDLKVIGSTLDFAVLRSLKTLRLKGSTWRCTGVDPQIFKSESLRCEGGNRLSSLTSLEVINVTLLIQIATLHSAPNLTVLVIDSQKEFVFPQQITFPRLRKLVLRNGPPLLVREEEDPEAGDTTILQLLQCEALEELDLDSIQRPCGYTLYEFIDRCGLDKTLLSLRLHFAYVPERTHEMFLHLSFSCLENLRSLTVDGELSYVFAELLRKRSDAGSETFLFPHLHEFAFARMSCMDHTYMSLVAERWRAGTKVMSFRDCKIDLVFPDQASTGLTRILGVETFVQEGLKLNIFFGAVAQTISA